MKKTENTQIQLLDCTLRDGGYINNWNWGYQEAQNMIGLLVKAGVDIVEVGFLRNVLNYDPAVTVCNQIEELNRILPENQSSTMFSAMAMRSNYDIKKLSPYQGNGIEMIRVTAHEYDISEGMVFAREVKEKGYKLSINPINIMGYSDEKLLWIIDQVNNIQPYQFSIVDTFGSMKRRDLDRIVSIVDHNLDKSIRVALHLHENMSLSCSLAQKFIDKHLNRPIAIDGSLMGMGRSPGNLPIELIADYLNDYTEKNYDIDYMMDAIQDYITPLKGGAAWGYTPAYFLSARFNLHRNYAEYYLDKGDLTNRDINHILASFDRNKASVFDSIYADKMYEQYKNNMIDDQQALAALKSAFFQKTILVLAPGRNIISCKSQIDAFIVEKEPVIITVNFETEQYAEDYAFFSNPKRYEQYQNVKGKLITTSNLTEVEASYKINYNRLSSAFEQGFNSYVMLLKLLKLLNVETVYAAGADGYFLDRCNYYRNMIKNVTPREIGYNAAVSRAVKAIGIDVKYITPSAYD